MKSRKLVFVFFLVICVVLSLWLLRQNHSTSDSETSETIPNPTASKQQVVATKVDGQQQTRTNPLSPNLSQPDPLNHFSNIVEKGKAEYLKKAVKPIDFYGKVVDENRQPIEGAEVTFSETLTSPASKTNSDVAGLFSLSGVSGRYLSVVVSKSGYYSNSNSRKSFDYSDELTEVPHRPDISNPVIFTLRKKGLGTPLITSQNGIFPALKINLPNDGSIVRVDFLNRKVGVEGQMEMGNIQPPHTDTRGPQEWSFHLSILNGGFVENSDEFPYTAPEAGYQSTIDFDFKPGDTNWTDNLTKHYYIVFGEPPEYGRIDIDTGIYHNVHLVYAINPTGARDLEPAEATPPTRTLPPGVTEVIPKNTK